MSFYVNDRVEIGPFAFSLRDSGLRVSRGLVGLFMGRGPTAHRVSVMPIRGAERRMDVDGQTEAVIVPEDDNPTEVLFQMNRRRGRAPGEVRTLVKIACAWGIAAMGLWLTLNKAPGWLTGQWGQDKDPFMWDERLALAQFLTDSIEPAIRAQLHQVTLAGLGLALLAVALIPVAWRRYQYARSTALVFALGNDAQRRFARLFAAVTGIAGAGLTWKGGRGGVAVGTSEPPLVFSNLSIPAMRIGPTTLHFYPDRVLVEDSGVIRAANYDQFAITLVVDTGEPHLHITSVFLDARIDIAEPMMAQDLPAALQGMDPMLSRAG